MSRLVMVSGAFGVGKSETLRAMRAALDGIVGEVAVLETDHFYMMIDPDWTCPPDRMDRYYAVSGQLLRETAIAFLRSGFDWVAIGSNGHWTEQRARDFVRPFHSDSTHVHHITLDPGERQLRERIAQRSAAANRPVDHDQTKAVQMLHRVRDEAGPWTHVLDNGLLTPAETARAIHDAVSQDRGLIQA